MDTLGISAFIRTNKIDLLVKILGNHEIVITEQVLNELRLSKLPVLRDFSNTKIKVAQSSSDLALSHAIHIGEASVIEFAKKNHALAIIDDKKARSVAQKEGINFIGTATIVKLGLERGSIKKIDARDLVEQLVQIGRLYFSDEIKKWIFEDV
ncbi:TPA: hypothetical protein HA238_00020 [Candidatus Micrarchaeota archaeon]|nr:hypothetical protein [Candidatus Micrarchaeota archaeon]